MSEPRLFAMFRHADESGVSGTGRVLDGVLFHTGQVVVCWRTDLREGAIGYSSITVFPSWQAFLHVHVNPHAATANRVHFGDGGPPPPATESSA
jgi:hypothetical protein